MNTLKWNRIFVTLICLTLALALSIGNVKASGTQQAQTDFAAIDAYVTEQMNNLGIPGMALGIVQDDQIVHLQGFGVADSSGRAVTPQTPFYIGSVTKSFTALAVMQLVEEGKINLDAPVQTYLPWFELADKEASAKITVRNLLNHTTGISTNDGDRDWGSQQGLEETVRGLGTIQPAQPVGKFQYSSLNYAIAGLIVEKVSGQSYADYVTQHIFEPLDMRHSYASHALALADGLSEGYHFMFRRAFRYEGARPTAHLPSGLLITSVEDRYCWRIQPARQLAETNAGVGANRAKLDIRVAESGDSAAKLNKRYMSIANAVSTICRLVLAKPMYLEQRRSKARTP